MKSVLRFCGSVYTSPFPCEWNIAEDGSVECVRLIQEEELDEESAGNAATFEKMMEDAGMPLKATESNCTKVHKRVHEILSTGPRSSHEIREILCEEYSHLKRSTIEVYASSCKGVYKSYGMWQLQQQLNLPLVNKKQNEQVQE